MACSRSRSRQPSLNHLGNTDSPNQHQLPEPQQGLAQQMAGNATSGQDTEQNLPLAIKFDLQTTQFGLVSRLFYISDSPIEGDKQ